jgi:hypothetical protein
VHAPSEEKSVDLKRDFYEELAQVFGHFPRYYSKILLGYFMQKWGERIFSNRQLGIRSLHLNSNANDVRIITFAISKKSSC